MLNIKPDTEVTAPQAEADIESYLALKAIPGYTPHNAAHSVEAATAESITQARSAFDATDPLAADRAARLRDHDRRLCNIAPAGCPAAPGAP